MDTRIEYSTDIDELGRCQFFLTWFDLGSRRYRSQVFFANPEQYGHPKPENRRPLQCWEGGDPKTCSCPDHGRSLIDYAGE